MHVWTSLCLIIPFSDNTFLNGSHDVYFTCHTSRVYLPAFSYLFSYGLCKHHEAGSKRMLFALFSDKSVKFCNPGGCWILQCFNV